MYSSQAACGFIRFNYKCDNSEAYRHWKAKWLRQFPIEVPSEEMYGEFADKVLEYIKMEFPPLEIVSDPSFPRSLWLQNHPDGTPHSDGKARSIEL